MTFKPHALALLQSHNCDELFDYSLAVDWAIELLQAGNVSDNVMMLASFSKPIDRQEIRPFVSSALRDEGLEELKGEKGLLATFYFHMVEILEQRSLRDHLDTLHRLSLRENEMGRFYSFNLLHWAWENLEESGENYYYEGVDLKNIEAVLISEASKWIDHYKQGKLPLDPQIPTSFKTKAMKAAVRRKYCSPSQIQVGEINVPAPKADEVLVKVHATTVNRTDCANLTAKPFIMRFVLGFWQPKKVIIGTDFAGEVVGKGANVQSFGIGDRVFGFRDTGSESQAEYTTAKESELFSIPADIGFKAAAASLEGAHYAYTFVHKVDLHAGQSILINGATGGIGSALLQFARQYDIHISATCNTKNIELVKSLGADKVYDYSQEDFGKGGEKFDFIFDAVGKSTWGKCKPLLKDGGAYISSELGPYSQNMFLPMFNSISKKKVIFPFPYPPSKTIAYIRALLEEGKFKPVIDREYALEDISDAYEYVMSGQKTGNVILNIVDGE